MTQRLTALALALGALVSCRAPEHEPRLVLVLVVDQLRSDRLDPGLPGGLGWLAREGRVFADATLDHAITETCPGHVAAATGRHPGPIGVPGNQWVDAETGVSSYCVDDPEPDAATIGAGAGRSPRAIDATGLGDWLKAGVAGARVHSVSAKDRAAISLGGRHPDAAWWLDRKEKLGFTTSRWYRPDLPAWVDRFNGEGSGGFVAGLPARWEHADDVANGARADEYEREIDRFERTSPHPLVDADRALTLERLFVSPFMDEVTLDFARALVVQEGLGQDDVPDLLAVSLSATDLVGHFYGPWSQESRDALLRLDAALGDFMRFLEARIGRGRLLVALTSDHGVLPLPEWLGEAGRSRCPVSGGRLDARGVVAALSSSLETELGTEGADHGNWLLEAGLRFTVNRARAKAAGVAPEAVLAVGRRFLAAQPAVRHVWSVEELEPGSGLEPMATLYRNSHHPTRGGDLIVQPKAHCLFSLYPAGTSHGTPYLYDRAVPLLFAGSGVERGVVRGRASVVDVAPTLADALGVALPPGLDGRVLPLD